MSLKLKRSLVRFAKGAIASFVGSALVFIVANPPTLTDYKTYIVSALVAGVTGLTMFLEKYYRWVNIDQPTPPVA